MWFTDIGKKATEWAAFEQQTVEKSAVPGHAWQDSPFSCPPGPEKAEQRMALWHQGTLLKTWNNLHNIPIPSQSENPIPRQCRDFRESGETAVGAGRLRKPFLQAFLIEQRSCGRVSPCGRASSDLGTPRLATKVAYRWQRRRKPGVVGISRQPSRVGGELRAESRKHTASPKPRLPETTLFPTRMIRTVSYGAFGPSRDSSSTAPPPRRVGRGRG